MVAKKKIPTTEDVLKDQQRQADAQRGDSAMIKKASNALTTDDSNPWIEVSAELDKFLGAPMCKFTKQGEFSISDINNVPHGTRCIAHADEIRLGWQQWVDGKPFDRCAGRVADGFVPPPRSELGDLDERQWELQDDGSRRDPLQFFMAVPITRLVAGGETCNFKTGTKGGLACVSRLTRAYGQRVRDEKIPGLPIVELRADHYRHRTYGKIFYPVMHIVGWTDANGKPLSLADELNDSIDI
jgi:hypothetical protein